MGPKVGKYRTSLSFLAGTVIGGLVAAGLFLSALYLFGTNAMCAQGILCQLAGYRNVGAAHGIHLVGTADPATELAVVWETPGRQHPPTVQYRPFGSNSWSTEPGISQRAPPNGMVASSSHIHRARITGLQPGARYEYRVSWDARSHMRTYSPVFVARTLASDEPVKLAFVSDTCLRNRPDGRSGPMDAIMDDLRRQAPDVILGGGDYACAVDDGRFAVAEPAIQRFFDEWQPLFSSVPFIAQYGNHDCCHGETPELWRPRLDLSWAPHRTADGKSFAFDLGDAHVVGFYATGADTTVDEHHLAWLDQTLQDARARGQRYLIVFQHAPLFGTGQAHPPHEALRRQLVPVLEQRRVDLHLSAHDMSYERTQPLSNAADGRPDVGPLLSSPGAGWNGVVYAKVSPTGRASSIENNLPPGLPPYIAIADDTRFHYATMVISPGGALEFTAYGFNQQGDRSVVDRFNLGP